MSVISGTLGAVMGSNATEDAAQKNKDVAMSGQAQQKEIYEQEVARQKPFYDKGVAANESLDKMMNGGYDMKESPAASYALTQGTRSLNRQLAARGLLGSGTAANKVAELTAGVAANDWNDRWGKLLDQVKIGTGASAAAGGASQNFSNQIGQTAQNLMASNNQSGQARAALYSGMGGASAGAANTAINAWKAYEGSGAGSAGSLGEYSYAAPEAGEGAASLSQYESLAL